MQRGRTEPLVEPRTLTGEGRSFLVDVLVPGTVAGLLGGALMLLFYMAASAPFGGGMWDLPKMISSFWAREAVLDSLGLGSILAGLALHFAVAVQWGVAFALLLPRNVPTMFTTFPLAMLFSALVYMVMVYFVSYWAAPAMPENLHAGLWAIGHAFYGASLALVDPMRRHAWVGRRFTPAFLRREVAVARP